MVQNEVEDNRRLLMPSVALRAFDPKQRALIGFKSSFRQRVRYGFRIDSLGFLIEANTVSEVVEEPIVYPIPQTPSWLVGLILSTGQKFQQAEEINPAVGPVEDDGPDEVEAMAEDGFEGALESFFKGIGCRSARACPVR